MSKMNTRKKQEKHLKSRTKRAIHNRIPTIVIKNQERKKTRPELKELAALLSRSAMINGRRIDSQSLTDLINYTVETNAGIGCVVEVAERLSQEGNYVITPELQSWIDKHDENTVKFNETATVCMAVLSGDGRIEEIPNELLMDIGTRSQALLTELAQPIMDIVSLDRELIETYLKEHNPDETYRNLTFKYALERITRLNPKYATPVSAEAEEYSEETE